MGFPLLTILALVPLVGSLITFALKGNAGKYSGMLFSLVTLALGIWAFIAARSARFSGCTASVPRHL